MKRQEFKEDEIPYSLLEPFGLSQDMIEDEYTDDIWEEQRKAIVRNSMLANISTR